MRRSVSRFYLRRDTGKLRTDCKSCHGARGAKWAVRNVDARRKIALRYARKNMDKIAAWKKENPERAKSWDRSNPKLVAAMKKKWKRENPHKILADVRRRQAAKLLATPPWSDLKAIEEIYRRARALGMEVDHIVPLRSKIVCGLHVPENLRIVTREVNRKKGNRHWPDMP